MITFVKLIRLPNSLMAGAGVVIGYTCADDFSSVPGIFWGAASLTLLAMGGYIQNDLADLATDRHSHPDRPLITHAFSEKNVRLWCYCLYFLGIAAACMTGMAHGVLAFIIVFLLWMYNKHLKGRVLVGNLTVSLLCALPLYYAECPGLVKQTLVPVVFAFLTTFAREIIKDIQDLDGDTAAGLATFPVRYGPGPAKKVAGLVMVLTLFFLPFPVLMFDYHISFGISAGLFVALPLLKALFQIISHDPPWAAAQKSLKITMLGGMASLVLGKVF
ncbi:geranylgeranylglycerol-phosphate geranylgeranyltransferase [Fibrobacterota bacterium]